MKPASSQSMASSVMSPNMTLGHLLSASNVMRCEKCSFIATDIAEFRKHMAREHIEYYCFYCNSVSLSEAELHNHLKMHTSPFPLKCPHCGQAYMRRMCLIKHIERFHSKLIPQESPKINSTKPPHIAVTSASPSVSTSVSSAAVSSSQRPAVRVTVPPPTATGLQLESNLQRLKSRDSYQQNANQSNAVLSNGHVQRNRALTVPLPEEVSIPAGCMVEVVEVKTVDGTKELRLRFVARQENESVNTKGKTTVPESSKVLFSHKNYQSTASESLIGTVNNKKTETRVVNKESPSRVTVNVPKFFANPSMFEKCRSIKRPLPEVINLDADVPSKVSRSFVPVGDPKVTTTVDPINHNVTPAALSSVFAKRIAANSVQPENLAARISPRLVEDRRGIQELPSSSTSNITSNVQSIPQIILAYPSPVPMKPSLLQNKLEPTKPQQSSNTRFLPSVQTPSVVLPPQVHVSKECKDKSSGKSFYSKRDSSAPEKTLPVKKPTKPSNTHAQLSAFPQEVKVENAVTEGARVEPEGFPVISSVYSLSQQPVDHRESSQPIVMAEWTNSGGRDSINITSVRSEQAKVTVGHQVLSGLKQGKPSFNKLPSKINCESATFKKDKEHIQLSTPKTLNSVDVKKEKCSPMKAVQTCTNENKICLKLKKTVNSVSKPPPVAENVSIPKAVEAKNENENSSKFLTVSLKRVQVGVWKKCKRKGKAVVSKSRSASFLLGKQDCTVLLLLPLRKDQAVKRPSPNQPVVVLNHPKPSIHVKRRTTSNRAKKDATRVPKCQILKMKLCKVTRKSYEVMGCTVQNFV